MDYIVFGEKKQVFFQNCRKFYNYFIILFCAALDSLETEGKFQSPVCRKKILVMHS